MSSRGALFSSWAADSHQLRLGGWWLVGQPGSKQLTGKQVDSSAMS